jgi:hypothetical protein
LAVAAGHSIDWMEMINVVLVVAAAAKFAQIPAMNCLHI